MYQMPSQSPPHLAKIRPATAKLVAAAAKVLFDADAISWEELGAIKAAMQELSRTGLLAHEPEKRLVDLHEVARLLAVSEQSLKRWLADGTINLPKVKIGQGTVRFRIADVEALMDNFMEVEEASARDDNILGPRRCAPSSQDPERRYHHE